MYKKFKPEIVFEDDDIIAVNKPSSLLTIPDRYDKNAPAFNKIMQEIYGEIFTVHRLDRDTTGILLFAKNADAHRHLNTQFEEHTIVKIYHAVVNGVVVQRDVRIDVPLIPNPAKKGTMIPSARGKESLSLLKVLERYRHSTLVEINLVTGRHHQLRAHVAAIGHPLLIDEIYGEASEFYLSSIKKKFNLKKNNEEMPIIKRITMHANSIEFTHPSSGDRMTLSADYPKDFRVLLQLLKKYSAVPNYFDNEL